MGLNSRQGGGSTLDPDARLYIAAVEAVLPGNNIATALPNAVNPKRIISDFIEAEKAASRWSLHKRIYLPIYANSAASAVDMVSRTSGEFTLSGVTHAAGYVQGNGTSGKFDWGASPDGVGLIDGSACIWRLVKQAHSTTGYNVPMGVTQAMPSPRRAIRFERSSGNSTFGVGANITAATDGTGIFIGSETATNSRFFRVRKTAGVTNLGTNTTNVTGGFPTITMQAMCARNDSTFSSYTDAQFGGYGMGLGMAISDIDALTANLKTLWESLTGLALP
jgi:hypothetical protein